MTGHKSLNYLIEGYKKFKSSLNQNDIKFFKELVEKGQKPKFLLISCSDSRVDPSYIMNCTPGDMFVIRNVANLVPPCENNTTYHGTSAALEFAISHLEVEHIIIFGHSNCGGIKYFVDQVIKSIRCGYNYNEENINSIIDRRINYSDNFNYLKDTNKNDISYANEEKYCLLGNSKFITKWLEIIDDLKDEVKKNLNNMTYENLINYISQKAMLHSAKCLMSFPWIKEKADAKKLKINIWQFNLKEQSILIFNEKTNTYTDIENTILLDS
ncbi:carbonic anhydrase [Lyticum sinuosum]|uniref:Carbonic anhydrase n=1 Tax=Lyticum sinuosum TaxID=1332059 RepID=A0AAE5AGX1_9RICK|nr:carbonic anhydrase [Lyticum sinuosum]MDZ5760905.1 Carbonic anhydrase [Lyticum sinuosum]